MFLLLCFSSRYIAEFKDQYMYIGNGISAMDKKTIFTVNKGLAIRMMRWSMVA